MYILITRILLCTNIDDDENENGSTESTDAKANADYNYIFKNGNFIRLLAMQTPSLHLLIIVDYWTVALTEATNFSLSWKKKYGKYICTDFTVLLCICS